MKILVCYYMEGRVCLFESEYWVFMNGDVNIDKIIVNI